MSSDTLASPGEVIRYLLSRDGKEINTKSCGVDYGGKITVVAQNETHAIWRKAGDTSWVSQGETGYYATEYWLVEFLDDYSNPALLRGSEKRAKVVDAIQPGRSRKVREAFIARLQVNKEPE